MTAQKPVRRNTVTEVQQPGRRKKAATKNKKVPRPIQQLKKTTPAMTVTFRKAAFGDRLEVSNFFAQRPGYAAGFSPKLGEAYRVVGTLHKHGGCYWLTRAEL